MAIPSAAAAQGLPSDPEADSPSGVVYEIPAERGRDDAAPNGNGGSQGDRAGGGSTPAGGGSETSIRSENNFGTSSTVPGAASKKGEPRNGDGRGSGDESAEGGSSVGDVAADTARSTAATTEGPSDEIVFPLIAVLVAAGILIGIVASRRAFRGRG
jgi:hypothetical protein